MDQWYAVIERATGALYSTGTVLADPMPDELEALPLDHEPDFEAERWNPAARAFVPIVVPAQ